MTGPTSGVPAPLSSRQGRHRQRYGSEGERLVAGCIPVRFNGANGAAGSAESVELLMLCSSPGKGYSFPKGGWEDDETVEAAAVRETIEEAGVRGILEEPVIGLFPFSSTKQVQLQEGPHGGRYIAHMFVMRVEEVLDVWPESGQRTRHWCSLAEAYTRCKYDWMREALHVWAKSKGWQLAAGGGASSTCSNAVICQQLGEASGPCTSIAGALFQQPASAPLPAHCSTVPALTQHGRPQTTA